MLDVINHNYLLWTAILIILIFGPDVFFKHLIKFLRKDLEQTDENTDWAHYSVILGWVERSLYSIFLFFLTPQFVTFVGIWLALKVVGSFNSWQPVYKDDDRSVSDILRGTNPPDLNRKTFFEYHRRRARHLIFTIGTGVSLLWVITIGLVFMKLKLGQ